MKQPTANPAAFQLTGGDIGVLLIHGFTGSASEYALLGPYLHKHGLTVAAPLLPGHGTTPADLNKQRWQDWVDHAEQALIDLQLSCGQIFVAGQSMGALIALELACRHPDLAGVIAYAPAIAVTGWRANFVAFLRYLTPTIAKPADVFVDPVADAQLVRYAVYPTAAAHEFLKFMRQTRRKLKQVASPLLIIEVAEDALTAVGSGQAVYDEVSSIDKKLVTLQHSGHVLTLDAEWEKVAAATLTFINEHTLVSVGQFG